MSISKPVRGFTGQAARVNAAAKINLCLRIDGRREDGYHILDSWIAPIGLFDHLSVRLDRSEQRHVSIQVEASEAISTGADNLACRAAALYLERSGQLGDVSIFLRKRIPVGAGLGGGSSDAAAVLRCLNGLADEPVDRGQLAEWALELGADVPFFLTGRLSRMRGVGEDLTPVPAPLLPGCPIVVAFPGVGLATREIYAAYDDSLTSERLTSRVPRLNPGQGPLYKWLVNDLEAAALKALPILRDLKRQLRALGARGVLMTGSGSAVFGVWSRLDDARAARNQLRADGTWACVTEILDQVPAVERDEQHGGRSPSW